MISQVNMLVVLFNNILDRRMIKLGQFKVSKELFGPTNTIQFIIDVYTQQARLQDSALHFRIVEAPIRPTEPLSLRNLDPERTMLGELPASLLGDHIRLQQVLANLLRNALRFSRSMPVYIFAAYDYYARKLVVQISDCGQGLSAGKLQEIRALLKAPALDETRSNEDEDDGSNLAICKKIIDLSGGEVTAYSAGTDQGAIFQFSMAMEEPLLDEVEEEEPLAVEPCAQDLIEEQSQPE